MIYLILVWNLMATDIFIQGSEISDILFEKKTMESGNGISYIDHLLTPNKELEEEVRGQFKQAQFEFLQGSLEVAKKQFKEVISKSLKNNWSPELQKTIHYCFLRLVQLEKDEKKKHQILKTAILFNPNLSPSTELFPPPIVKSYETLKTKMLVQIWPLPKNSSRFSKILINGRPIDSLSSFFRYRQGEVRLSFLSNKFQPVHMVTKLSNLKSRSIPQNPMALGSCLDPQIQVSPLLNKNFRLIEEQCESHQTLAITQNAGSKHLPTPSSTHSKKGIFKNKWFWIGVSTLVAGAAISASQQNNRGNGSNPSAKTGPQEISNN